MSKNGLSRQRKWQLKQLQAGCCPICGTLNRSMYARCPGCMKQHRGHQKTKPWKRGGRGRPPLKAKA